MGVPLVYDDDPEDGTVLARYRCSRCQGVHDVWLTDGVAVWDDRDALPPEACPACACNDSLLIRTSLDAGETGLLG